MIVHPDVENYIRDLTGLPDPVLEEMAGEAAARHFPIMGPEVGRLLVTLIQFSHVHTVLECGSGFGYSALWMALALSENARITCIEADQTNIERAKYYFEKAGQSHKVSFVCGNALEVVPTLKQTYDLIVNDIDKEGYPQILPRLVERLRTGGMLVTDNVLWGGKVTGPAPDPATAAVQEYNRLLAEADNLWNSFIPLRDGVALSVKLRKKEKG